MKTSKRQALLVVDLGYGDAGKGSIVDYLTRESGAHTVVRYCGGAQAAHNVVTADGRHHTFAQFGSGSFVAGTRTYLSRYMMVNPLSLLREERHLRSVGVADAWSRLFVDREALVTTPFHVAANRLRELARGAGRHGSCGMGIGETMSDFLAYGPRVLFAGDLADPLLTARKLKFIRDAKWDELHGLVGSVPETKADPELSVFSDPEAVTACAEIYQAFAGRAHIVDGSYLGHLLRLPGSVIFEGAQGILIDEWFGFHPYTTWSTTTLQNALALLREHGYADRVTRLGVIRAFATRHGPGPFVTEDAALTASLREGHNATNPWQHEFRVGYPDLVATRYAIEVTDGVDVLAVTQVDRLADMPEWKLCSVYRYSGPSADLPTYFDVDGARITRIRVRRPPDLTHQAQLTRLLDDCAAEYGSVRLPTVESRYPPTDPVRTYLQLLEEHLSLPVAITSWGRTAEDKSSELSTLES